MHPSRGLRSSLRFGAVAALLVLSAAGQSAAQDGPPAPADSLLLFVASWCAPCHRELRELAAIAQAVHPARVLVVPVDDRPATRRMLHGIDPDRIWTATTPERRMIRQRLMAGVAGLPYGVLTDAAGNPCATSNQGLDRARAAQLLRRCTAR